MTGRIILSLILIIFTSSTVFANNNKAAKEIKRFLIANNLVGFKTFSVRIKATKSGWYAVKLSSQGEGGLALLQNQGGKWFAHNITTDCFNKKEYRAKGAPKEVLQVLPSCE